MSVTWGLINSVPTAAFKNQRFVLAIKKQSKVMVAFVAALCPNVEYFLDTGGRERLRKYWAAECFQVVKIDESRVKTS